MRDPTALATVWKHFGFFNINHQWALVKSEDVCSLCHSKIKYLDTKNKKHAESDPEEERNHPGASASASASDVQRSILENTRKFIFIHSIE